MIPPLPSQHFRDVNRRRADLHLILHVILKDSQALRQHSNAGRTFGMRVTAWNCNGGFHRKIGTVGALASDILVVPECGETATAQPDLGQAAPTGFEWVGPDHLINEMRTSTPSADAISRTNSLASGGSVCAPVKRLLSAIGVNGRGSPGLER